MTARILAAALLFGASVTGAEAAALVVDNFESSRARNRLGNRSDIFMKEPSKALLTFSNDVVQERETRVLKVRYDQRNEGGPGGEGGWCGWYTLLKSPGALVAPTPEDPDPAPQGEQFFNALSYKRLTFWVRGESGDENFVVGLADRHWDRIGDSVKSQEIGRYLPEGRLTASWQKAVIPLEEFFIDHGEMASISIVFEKELFGDAGHAGTVYIDDIILE